MTIILDHDTDKFGRALGPRLSTKMLEKDEDHFGSIFLTSIRRANRSCIASQITDILPETDTIVIGLTLDLERDEHDAQIDMDDNTHYGVHVRNDGGGHYQLLDILITPNDTPIR